jgi:uncharacterized repeat protein (TIGR03843 family)
MFEGLEVSVDAARSFWQAERLLASGRISPIGTLRRSSNRALLVSVAAGDNNLLEAVYKPAAFERPLWDFEHRTLYKRELAAYKVSCALRWWIVPPTVTRDGPFGVGSLQAFVDAAAGRTYFEIRQDPTKETDLARIFAFDVVVNNADRKAGHCLQTSDGKVWSIDHGTCFHEDYKLRTVMWDMGGRPLEPEILEDLERLGKRLDDLERSFRCKTGMGSTVDSPSKGGAGFGARSLEPHKEEQLDPLHGLKELLSEGEIRAMRQRLQVLLRRGSLPSGGSDADFPWPVI